MSILEKRLVKQPKIYLRDSGILHSLLSLEDFDQLHSHPKFGASWEGFALEITCRSIDKPANALFFWRTHNGAELDLFWQAQGKNWGIEFKYSDAPSLSKSMNIATQDLELSHLWVVYPGKEAIRCQIMYPYYPWHLFQLNGTIHDNRVYDLSLPNIRRTGKESHTGRNFAVYYRWKWPGVIRI